MSAPLCTYSTTERTSEWSENIMSTKFTILYLAGFIRYWEQYDTVSEIVFEFGAHLAPILSWHLETVRLFASHSYATVRRDYCLIVIRLHV